MTVNFLKTLPNREVADIAATPVSSNNCNAAVCSLMQSI
jgi:hypothetical protein